MFCARYESVVCVLLMWINIETSYSSCFYNIFFYNDRHSFFFITAPFFFRMNDQNDTFAYLSLFKSLKWQSSKEWFARFWHINLIDTIRFLFDAIDCAIWLLMWETSSWEFRFKMFRKTFDESFHEIRMWSRHLNIARQICVDVMHTGLCKIRCSGSSMTFTTENWRRIY